MLMYDIYLQFESGCMFERMCENISDFILVTQYVFENSISVQIFMDWMFIICKPIHIICDKVM